MTLEHDRRIQDRLGDGSDRDCPGAAADQQGSEEGN
jgi:hypothetical protein